MFKGKTMVTFNELRITPDGNTLIIDVAIKDLRYYDNVGLDTILIDTQDTFTAEGPSSKAVRFPIINSIDAESFEQEFGDTYDFKGTLKKVSYILLKYLTILESIILVESFIPQLN